MIRRARRNPYLKTPRKEKTSFCPDPVGRGRHLPRYRMRAEVPGIFHALPTVVQGMYAPQLRANSNEQLIPIEDN
ncbi:MAG: hypothetical protein ACOC7S_01510 [Planctomycetota bacterium]